MLLYPVCISRVACQFRGKCAVYRRKYRPLVRYKLEDLTRTATRAVSISVLSSLFALAYLGVKEVVKVVSNNVGYVWSSFFIKIFPWQVLSVLVKRRVTFGVWNRMNYLILLV